MAIRRGSSVVVAALVIGAIAALTEMVPVFPIQGALGVSPRLVLQSIASGLLGRQAYSGGAATVLLGIALHLLISFLFALAYVVVGDRWAALRRHPWVAGIGYGTVVFAVMRYIVVPLSAVALQAVDRLEHVRDQPDGAHRGLRHPDRPAGPLVGRCERAATGRARSVVDRRRLITSPTSGNPSRGASARELDGALRAAFSRSLQ